MPSVRALAAWALIMAVFVSFSACSSKRRVYSAYDTRRYLTEHDLRNIPQGSIPLVVNERVIAWMEYFQGAGRKHFKRYLERSSKYLPLMKSILREQGMPTDLVYIALIESGFNNHAYSRAAAVGPWQFIGSTGRNYGLKQTGWIDERRDPVRSTYAAAKLFRDLYNDYGDWYIAMVGYNAGPGRANKAIKMTGCKDFWVWADHRKALRAETRDYVPKFIAAAIMAKNPEKFGFSNLDYHDAWEHESAPVKTQTDLSVVAKCAGVDEQKIFDLNPHLIRGTTPPGQTNYRVRLPKGTTQKFLLAYAKIPEDERVQIVRHKVRRGDTLYKIARKYGVGVNSLAKANGLSRRSRLSRGKTLIVPVGSYAKYARYDKGSSAKKKKLVHYRVKRGDTLSRIASKYRGVTVSDLKRWNRIRRSHIRVGQRLKIYTRGSGTSYASSSSGDGGRKAKYHKVRRGETIGSIARKYGTSTKQLMALNGIKNPKSLRAGKRIKVRAGSTGSNRSSGGSSGGNATSTYIVKSGDTPGTIAQRFGMSSKQLMALNGIENPKSLRPGMKLKVRARKGAARSSETTTAIALSDAKAPTGSGAEKLKSVKSTKTYRVKPGETLGGIANRHGMSTKQLMALNGITNPKRVRAGQKLRVSGGSGNSSANTTAVKLDNGSSSATLSKRTHTVKSGETLGTIAAKYGVSTKQLMAWNGIKDARRVRAGRKLVVKGGSKPKSSANRRAAPKEPGTPVKLASASPGVPSGHVTHRVKSGETLWDIARKHNVSISELQSWNNLTDPSAVRAGTSLKIVKN